MIKIYRVWAMSRKNTFDIKPIKDLIYEEKTGVDSELILVIDDHSGILDHITLETNFPNVHINHFIE